MRRYNPSMRLSWHLRLLASAWTLCVLVAPHSSQAQWPQFRGPQGDGHVVDASPLPLHWSETENVTFKVPVPGQGWSSPIVQDGKIWLTSAVEQRAEDNSLEHRSLRALAYDLDDGTLLHDIEVFRPASWQPSHDDNSYASPTPVAAPGRVYVHFGAYGTAALDSATGEILWKRHIALQHEVGPGSSPILYDDLLILTCDGTDEQFVIALHTSTGGVAWRSERSLDLSEAKGPHRKAFSTPLVVHYQGQDQLISPGASQVNSYDPRTGEELWRVRYEGYSNVPRPVAGFGMVYVNTGYMKPHLLAIHLGGQGDVTGDRIVWDYWWQVAAQPSPLLIDNRIFMINDWGNATWIDAHRGEDLWRHRVRGKYTASPLYADGRIYNFSQEGKSVVLAAKDTVEVLATNQLDEGIKASPAVADGALLIRTVGHLYRVEEQKTSKVETPQSP